MCENDEDEQTEYGDEDVMYWRMGGNQELVEQEREGMAEAALISDNSAAIVSMYLANVEGF